MAGPRCRRGLRRINYFTAERAQSQSSYCVDV
ncbi:hypothetical protein PC116_g15312 [Phytophthora cactorum]|nr:hypothetical protein Pcac1_g7862 [Phytophthora cactorum]KAG2926116.1 hypothetical protein PC114_g3919 [Phytophthora cactorum]KAG3039907.1 hypothetical protein PC119_g1838 [Phytophthora cactorum]KAG3205631.1 hypothetical protein PC128_g1352 [Phytophthora cactorum]KAG4236597.1 hypothetical protein PC116_g15312 [Phytophthora cactorum]